MGILGAIALLGQINEGKTDKETHVMVKKIIKAMDEKKRQEWPNKELRAMINQMDSIQRKYFLDVLKDMDEALEEHYGQLED